MAARANASDQVLRLVAQSYPDAIEVMNQAEKLPFELSERSSTWFAQLAAYLGRYVLQNGAGVRARARARVQTRVKTRAKADRVVLQSN